MTPLPRVDESNVDPESLDFVDYAFPGNTILCFSKYLYFLPIRQGSFL